MNNQLPPHFLRQLTSTRRQSNRIARLCWRGITIWTIICLRFTVHTKLRKWKKGFADSATALRPNCSNCFWWLRLLPGIRLGNTSCARFYEVTTFQHFPSKLCIEKDPFKIDYLTLSSDPGTINYREHKRRMEQKSAVTLYSLERIESLLVRERSRRRARQGFDARWILKSTNKAS